MARSPAHLWIVGALGVLWNGFGCYDYVMTQTGNVAHLEQFSEAQRLYFQSFPAWTEAAWACGVWGGLAGALLLLARSRHAVTAFAVSLVGLALTQVYQHLLSSPPEGLMSGAMLVMTLVIWAVAIALLFYAVRMRRAGALR